MRFSASRLRTWMTCPLQAHFKYDLVIPVEKSNAKAVFGTAIHAALEHYNTTANVKASEQMFLDLWQNPEKIGSPVGTLWWPKFTTFGSLKERGSAIVRDFDERCQWDKREVIATEHPFLVPFGEHELTGYVDLFEVRKSGKGRDLLRVVDYKTSSRKPNMSELLLDVQFTVYLYASTCIEFWMGAKNPDGTPNPDYPPVKNADWMYEMYDGLPRRAIWYHLWDPKEIDAGPRVEADFMRLYRVCCEIDKANKASIHVPKLGEACTLCDFRDPCGIEIPTREEIAAQDEAWV